MFDRTYYATHREIMERVSNEKLRDRYLIHGLFREGEVVLNYTHADRFVIAIAPGYIATNNTSGLKFDNTRNRRILERVPAACRGDPADLGGAAVFLASSAVDYIQGYIRAADGDWLAQ